MYGYSRRPTSSSTVLDPLGTQAIRRPGHLSGHGGKDVLGESTSYISNFTYLMVCSDFNYLMHVGIFSFGRRR
jgi:hypothetical protein